MLFYSNLFLYPDFLSCIPSPACSSLTESWGIHSEACWHCWEESYSQKRHSKSQIEGRGKKQPCQEYIMERLLNLSLIAHNYFLPANATVNNKYNNIKTINENYEKSNCHKLRMHI